MKKMIQALLVSVVSSTFVALPAVAGDGHSHGAGGHSHGHGHSHEPIDQETAIIKATQTVKGLVKNGKIPQSWLYSKAESAEQKTFAKGPEWVVIFKNTSIKEEDKQTLYLFYSLDGHYIAANYTGN